MIVNCRRGDANSISFALVMHHVAVRAYVGGVFVHQQRRSWRSMWYIWIRSVLYPQPYSMKITVPDYCMALSIWSIRSRQRRKADVRGWHKTFWLPSVIDTMITRSISIKILTSAHWTFIFVRHDDQCSVSVWRSLKTVRCDDFKIWYVLQEVKGTMYKRRSCRHARSIVEERWVDR